MKQPRYRCNAWKSCKKGCQRWFPRIKAMVCDCESIWVMCDRVNRKVRTEKVKEGA